MSILQIYNGKTFNAVEIKGEMVGHYLGEFSISYKPGMPPHNHPHKSPIALAWPPDLIFILLLHIKVKHGRPGIGATHSSRFIPLK